VAITNCLNFGNPYKPEVYWTFEEAIQGIGDACRALKTPVTGGNVSLYNEHPDGAVFPTPTIGMLGVVEDLPTQATSAAFQAPGDAVLLLTPSGWTHPQNIDGTEYLARIHGRTAGDAPHLDLGEEVAVQEATQDLIRSGLVNHAHDVADGGLAICLAESSIHGMLGADLTLPETTSASLAAALFGEAQSRIVVSVAPEKKRAAYEAIGAHGGVQMHDLGVVTDGHFRLTTGGAQVVHVPVDELAQAYHRALPDAMQVA
jgi:phosphoribosylformylglycinamidine synthase